MTNENEVMYDEYGQAYTAAELEFLEEELEGDWECWDMCPGIGDIVK